MKIAPVFVLFLASCSALEDKDQLLIKDVWVLQSRAILDHSLGTDTITYFKKSDSVVTLKFNEDGTVNVTEESGSKTDSGRWKWSADKKKILIDGKALTIDKLTSKSLEWSQLSVSPTKTTMEDFRHSDDPEWTDGFVDGMNSRKFKP